MARAAKRRAPAPAAAQPRPAPARAWLLATTALLPIAAGPARAQPAPATGPTGGQVVAGQAGIARTPGRTTITQGTDRAAIDWQQFNVGSQHTVQFVQPSQGSWTLNRVTGPDPSVIAGRVQANGGVAIVNQSGMVFARGAQVDVGSLIASTANITNQNFMAGRMVFDGASRPGARIENHGTITVAERGLAALVAPGVSNSGVIRARLGRVALGAAETFVLDLAGDGLIGIDVTQAVRSTPDGGAALVTNSGVIEAPGGSVLLTAHAASGLVEDLVRQTGRIEAPSLGARTGEVALRAEGGGLRVEGRVAATGGTAERGGRIALQATGTVTVAAGARVDASGGAGAGQVLAGTTGRGRSQRMAARTIVERDAVIRADATVAGDGGMLVLNSLDHTQMRGTLSARGGPGGGNGGFVELSGQGALEAAGVVDVRAPAGIHGELLLDPQNIIVSNTVFTPGANPGDPPVSAPGGLPAGDSVTVQITTLPAGTVTANTGADSEWTRISAAAITGFAGTVTLDAARDIIVDDAIAKANGGLGLLAGRSVTVGAAINVAGALTIAAGTGSIAIEANTFATSMALTARTGISQSGGAILRHRAGLATPLNLTASVTGTGDVALGGANGRIALQGGGTSAGAFTVASADRLTLAAGQTLAVQGLATLTAGGSTLDLAGTLRATGAVLSGATGIAQAGTGGIAHVTTGSEVPVTASAAAGNITLDGAGNGVLALAATTLGTGALTVAAEGLRVTGPLTADAMALAARSGALAIGADLRATGLTLTARTGITQDPGTTIAHRSGAGTALGLSVNVTGTGDAVLANGNGRLSLLSSSTADGALSLASAEGITLPATEVLSVAGALGLTVQGNNNALLLDGQVHATSLALSAQGNITQGVDGLLAFRAAGSGDADLATALPVSVAATGNNHAIALGAENGTLRVTGATTERGDIAIRGRNLDIAGPVLAGGSGANLSNVTLTAFNDGTATGELSLSGAGTIAANALTLNAARNITQEVTATIALDGGDGLLTIRGGGGGPITRAGSVSLTAANSFGELDLRALVASLPVLTGDVAVTATGPLSVLQASGTTLTLRAPSITVAAGQAGVSGVGDVRLVADTLAVNAGVGANAGGAGGTLSLRGDALSVGAGGSLASPGGTVEIGPRTAGRTMQVGGGANPASLRPDAADLAAITADTLRLGATTVPGEGTVTAGQVTIAQALATSAPRLDIVATAGIAVDAALGATRLRLDAGGAIALGAVALTATGAGSGIELRAGGTITQAAGGVLAAGSGTADLVAHAGIGGLALAGQGGFVLADGGTPAGAAGPRSLFAPGSAAFATDGTLRVAATAEAAALSLTAASLAIEAPLTAPAGTVALVATGTGGITQEAGGIITAALLNLDAAGPVALAAAPNEVAALGSLAFTTALAFRNAGPLDIAAPVAPIGGGTADIAFTADSGALRLLAPISAGTGTLRLTASAGDVLQADLGATLSAGRLEAVAGNDVLLAAAANAVAVLGTGSAGGSLAFAATGDLALEGTIAQTAPGGSLVVTSGGALAVEAGAALGFETITLAAPGAMALRGTIGLDDPTPLSVVRLGAGGAITQEAGGRLVADVLGLRSGGDAALGAGTNDVRAVAASAVGSFALDTAGPLTTTTLAGVPLSGAGIGGVQGSNVTLSAAGLTIQPAGLALIGAGAHASAADGVLSLRADRLTLAGNAAAGDPSGSPAFNGTIIVEPRTAGRAVSLGADDPGALSLATAGLARLVARNLVIGGNGAGAGTLTVAGPASVLNGVDSVLLRGGGIALEGGFALPTFGGLLTLRAAAGDIAQGAAGALTADRLAAIADAGSVDLGAANLVGRVSGAAASGGRFAFTGAGGFTIEAPGIAAAGAEVALAAAAGGIAQTSGARITADRLSASAPGTVALDGGGAGAVAGDLNAIGTLAASEGASLTLRNAAPLAVEGAAATAALGGLVALEAPGLTLRGDVTAAAFGGHVVLRTGANFDAPAAGAIVQEAGIIRARDLSVSAGGDVALGQANEVARLVAGLGAAGIATNAVVTAPGSVFVLFNALPDLQAAAPVSVGGTGSIAIFANGLSVAPALVGQAFLAPGGVVQFAPFAAGGTIGLGGPGGLDTTTITAAAIERVTAARLVIGALEPFDAVSSGTITLRGALDLTAPGRPQALELRSGGSIAAEGFALSVANISAHAAGDIAIGTPASRIGAVVAGLGDGVAGLAAGGTLARLTTAGADAIGGLFTLAAPITTAAGGTIVVQAPDFALGAALDTGAGLPGRIELRSPRMLSLGGSGAEPGTARLTAAELTLLDAHGGTLLAAAPDIRLAGAWTLDPTAAARLELALTPGGAGTITQAPGGLSAAALGVTALAGAGRVQLDQPGNALPVAGITALGDVSLATEGALDVRRTTSAFGDVAYRAAHIRLSTEGLLPGQATIEAPTGTVRLTATAGDITGTALQAAVRANALVTNGGELRLTGDNTVGTLVVESANGVLFRNTGALAAGAGGPVIAVDGDLDITATTLTLNNIVASGTVRLEATTGDILQAAGALFFTPRLDATAAGSITIDSAAPDGAALGRIGALTALSAGGDITLRNGIPLTIDLPLALAANRALTLEAPSLTIADTLSVAGPGGRIVLRTGGFPGGAPSGGDIIQTAGTISAAQLAALAGGTVSLDRPGNAIGALGGGTDGAGTPIGLGLAGTQAVLRSSGFGGEPTLIVTGTLEIAPGGALTLRANDVALGAALRAPGGAITLLPVTADAGIGYVLGGPAGSAAAGRITLDSAELAFVSAGELRLGARGVTGAIDIAGAVDLVDGGTPRVTRLSLAGDGALVQAPGTLLDAAVLSADLPGGAVLLDPGTAGNRIGALAGVVAGGDVVVRGGAGLMELRDGGAGTAIDAPAGARVTLRVDDLAIQAAIRAPGGTISLLPETPGRTVTLGIGVAGTLSLGSAELARIGGAPGQPALRLRIGADGTLRTAGDILLAGDVPLRGGASEAVRVLDLAAGGTVRQVTGSVAVATLTGSAQGDFRLDGANGIDTFALVSAGRQDGGATLPADVALRGTGDVQAGGITATRNLAITAGGTLATVAATIPGGGTGLGIAAGETVRLDAGAGLSAGGVTGRDILLRGDGVALTGRVGGDGAPARSLAIDSTGVVGQQAGAIIDARRLTLNGTTITLPEGNLFAELGDVTATGPVLALNTLLPLVVSGNVAATGSLALATAAGLTVAPAGSITVTGGPGSATLTAAGAIIQAGRLAASGAASLTAGTAFTFTGSANLGGDAGFAAGTAMALSGTIGAAGRFDATAGGALSTTAQITAGGDAALTAGGALTASGRVQSAGGALALTAAAGLAADGTFAAATAADVSARGGAVSLAGTLAAGGPVRVIAPGGAITLRGALTAGAALDAAAAGNLDTTAQLRAGTTLSLSAGGSMLLGGSQVAGNAFTATAGGGLDATGASQAGTTALLQAGQSLALRGSLVAADDLTARAGTTLAFTGTGFAGGRAELGAGGTMTLGGSLQAGNALALAAGGGLATSATLRAGEDATLSAGGRLDQAGDLAAGGAARLSAGGDIAATGRLAAGGALTLAAGGNLTLAGPATAGTQATLTAGADARISGQVTAGTGFDLAAGGAATLADGKLTAGTTVRVTAGQELTLRAFSIDPETILLQASGALTVADSTLAAQEGITLTGTPVTLRNSVFTTDALDAQSAGTMTLDGGRYVIGRAVVFAAPGGIATTGRITVVPRDSLLPAVVFDTRAAAPRTPPLLLVEPDEPGLPSRQQATQVRVPGTEAPGAFGPASNGPAGPLTLDIDAGRSAIFILIDGGSVTGTVVSAGRLGIHGTGGSADLFGRLTDVTGSAVGGAAAARFADSTRPAASGALTRYRLNGCVVSSVNCLVPSQVITIPQAPPQRVDIRLGGGRITDPDVMIPNVAEEDY